MTVVIPTFGREEVLVATLQAVLRLASGEVIVVDQTLEHEAPTKRFLSALEESQKILWIRLAEPSIPQAMNTGLIKAKSDLVLFLDDDVEPSEGLLITHETAHAAHPDAGVVVGQILQPGEKPRRQPRGEGFRFCSETSGYIHRAMAGNMSVKRSLAMAVGGFDENFIGAAYMFETEFAERMARSGGRIYFEASASLRHLRASSGGTRSSGSHLRTLSPAHSCGAYYYIFLTGGVAGSWSSVVQRLFSSVITRHHLRKPWWIPLTLISEIRGTVGALSLIRKGPRLLPAEVPKEAGIKS